MSKKEVSNAPNANLPAHLQNAQSGAGNENITSDDLELPRLKLLQAMSPECAEGGDMQIVGAKAGMSVNTMSGELLEDIYCINVFFGREFPVFRDRQMGGDGIPITVEKTAEEAKAYITENGLSTDEFNVVETARHLLLVCDEEGNPLYEAIMLMSATRLRLSSQWNSKIVNTHMDRYANLWKLTPKRVTNTKGSWFTYEVELSNYASEAAFNQAHAMYNAVASTTVSEAA